MTEGPNATPDDEQQALLDALRALLGPMARLAVARGLPCAALEEALRRAVVDAAAQAHPDVAPSRSVSRIATATGLNRREVTRLVQASADAEVATHVHDLRSEGGCPSAS